MSEENVVSKFNEAALAMKRADMEQTILNVCKKNLIAFNMEFQDYNYQIVFKCLTNLYLESKSKFTNKEIGETEAWRKAISEFISKNKIHFSVKKQFGRQERKIDYSNLKILEEILHEYETLIRKCRDLHGLSSPNVEDDEGL